MIGFSLPVSVYADGFDEVDQKALLTLDLEAIEGAGKPMLDVRLAGGNDVVISVEIEDAYAAVYEIQTQLNRWVREQQGEREAVSS